MLLGINSSNKWFSEISKSFRLLDDATKRKLILVGTLQSMLSILDLIGVALIGLIGSISVSGIQSQAAGSRVFKILSFMQLSDFSLQSQVAVLGLSATVILISRSMFSILLTRKYIYFLSFFGSKLTIKIFEKLMSSSILQIRKQTIQETLYGLTDGIRAITLGIMASTISLFTDLVLMFVILLGLFFADVVIAVSTLILFGVVGLMLHKLMSKRSQKIGRELGHDSIELNEVISEYLNSYREAHVFNTKSYYFGGVSTLRNKVAKNQAEIQFMPSISKYIIELTTIIGAIVVAGLQFTTKDAVHAIAILGIFMAAGSRIGPSVMRVQQNIIQIRSSIGLAEPGFQMINSFDAFEQIAKNQENSLEPTSLDFDSTVKITELSYGYPGSEKLIINKITMSIEAGSFLAIAGPSGAGKSTFVDLILGVITPNEGVIEISGATPNRAVSIWPGKIAYVPQSIYIANKSIRENVALGVSKELIDDKKVRKSLELAQLLDFVDSNNEALDFQVGENGSKLSGGQKQRLGIARALYREPSLLILDEATSSLDVETEALITETLRKLKGNVTLIVVAHRLSTIIDADEILYFNDGDHFFGENMEDIRNQVREFSVD